MPDANNQVGGEDATPADAPAAQPAPQGLLPVDDDQLAASGYGPTDVQPDPQWHDVNQGPPIYEYKDGYRVAKKPGS